MESKWMGRVFSSLLGISIIIFTCWIFLAPNKDYRIARACQPVDWFGNISESMVALIYPSIWDQTERTFDSIEYACRYTVWRLFWQKDYTEMMKNRDVENHG